MTPSGIEPPGVGVGGGVRTTPRLRIGSTGELPEHRKPKLPVRERALSLTKREVHERDALRREAMSIAGLALKAGPLILNFPLVKGEGLLAILG